MRRTVKAPGSLWIGILILALAACTSQAGTQPPVVGTQEPSPMVTSTLPPATATSLPETAVPTTTTAPIQTDTPSATDTAPPSTETQESPTATSDSGSGVVDETYLDDRSTPTGLVQSYFNAVNRREYLRAYSYWRDPESSVGSFESFEQGYVETQAVEVTLGEITGDAGAGSVYYTVPALLQAQTTSGEEQTFAACYVIHLSQPGIQGAPPFAPMSLERGTARLAEEDEEQSTLLESACAGPDFPTGNPIDPLPVTDRSDISADNYLDDRSGPVEVLSSLFNAINRKEYVRAYSYWEDPESNAEVPPFESFEAGYAETESVQLTTGEVGGDAGAGQFYYTVPVVLQAQTIAGETQTFAGCYTLHLSNPGAQATPPFRPMAIRSADVRPAASDADPAELLADACQ